MALRLANKINRQFVKNAYRSLSAKRDIPEVETISQNAEETSTLADAPPQSPPTISSMSTAQYEVCRPRTTPIAPYPHVIHNETDAVKNALALQHLQPAMLPEYYKPPVEINAPCMYLDPVSETERQSLAKQRKFEESKTCKNVTLPLKAPKLASPFPDPVKVVMHSNTVSDQEKAQQMLAEARMIKQSNEHSMKHKHSSIRSLPPSRSYSTSIGGGKKLPPACQNVQTKCPKRKLPGCKPVSKNVSCKKKKHARPPCAKKQSPYPSYSESCHEDVLEKPSECKICPYKFGDHPTFKPPKQSLHTATANFSKKKSNSYKQPTPMVDASLSKIAGKKTYSSSVPSKEIPNNELKAAPKKTATQGLDRFQPENILVQPLSSPFIKTAAEETSQKSRCTKFPFKETAFDIVKQRKPRPRYTEGCPKKPRPKLINDCPPPPTEDDCRRRISIPDNLGILLQDRSEDEKQKEKCRKPDLRTCLDPNEIVDRCKKKKTGKTLICPDDLLGKKPKNKKKKTCPVIPFDRFPFRQGVTRPSIHDN